MFHRLLSSNMSCSSVKDYFTVAIAGLRIHLENPLFHYRREFFSHLLLFLERSINAAQKWRSLLEQQINS